MKTTLEKTITEMRKVIKVTEAAKKRGVKICAFVHVDFPDGSGQYMGHIDTIIGCISIEQLQWKNKIQSIGTPHGSGRNLQECVRNFLNKARLK